MANKKVVVSRRGIYIQVDGATKELEPGDQSIDSDLAKKLLGRGLVSEPKKKAEKE